MRTTLKRRIGRWEQVTGNGRAASPTAARRAISRYEQPAARGRVLRGIGRYLLNAALFIAIVAGGAAGGLYLWANEKIGQTAATSPGAVKSQKYLHVVTPNQAVVALVVGYDKRRGLVGDQGRSDTVMLVRLDPRKGSESITLLSFPRDLRVPLYCNPNYSFATGKINSAFSRCGLEGAVLTVKALTGLPINYDAQVNFRGFKDIVNKMGGVWIDVDRRYYVPPGAGYASIDLQPGYQRLRGGQALDYARYRHGDSDLFRIIRQQAFIRSFRQQFSKLSLLDYPSIVNTIAANIEAGNKGGGSIPAETLLGYAQVIHGLSGGGVVQVKLDNVASASNGSSDLVASPTTIANAVDAFMNPDLTANTSRRRPEQGRRRRVAGRRCPRAREDDRAGSERGRHRGAGGRHQQRPRPARLQGRRSGRRRRGQLPRQEALAHDRLLRPGSGQVEAGGEEAADDVRRREHQEDGARASRRWRTARWWSRRSARPSTARCRRSRGRSRFPPSRRPGSRPTPA